MRSAVWRQTRSLILSLGNFIVKSALKIIAFANNDPPTGIVALLETALEALDSAQQHIPAALVSSALHAYTRSLNHTAELQTGRRGSFH